MSRSDTNFGPASNKRKAKNERTSWAVNNVLSISRKILQRTVVKQDPYVESLKRNNVDLARRVSELQKEFAEQTDELREAREEVYKLRRQLVRLQIIKDIIASSDFPEKLLSLSNNAYRFRDILLRACNGLNHSQSCSDLSNENMATTTEPAAPVSIGEELRPNWPTGDCQDHPVVECSVEMELDDLLCSLKSYKVSSGRQAVLPEVEDVDMTPPRTDIEQIDDSAEELPPEASPGPKPGKKKSAIVKKASLKVVAAASALSDQTESAKPATSLASSSESVIRTDKKLPSSELTVAASPGPFKSKRKKRDYFEPEVIAEDKRVKTQEEDKSDSIASPAEFKIPSRRKSGKRRRRLRLIQDDSIYIPISDMTMESVKNSEILRTDKKDISTPKESSDRPSEIEEEVDIKAKKKSKLKSKKFPPKGCSINGKKKKKKKAQSVKSEESPIQSKALSTGGGSEKVNSEVETQHATSSMGERGSLLSSSIRPRRNSRSVSYVIPRLNAKVRQGDKFWCKD